MPSLAGASLSWRVGLLRLLQAMDKGIADFNFEVSNMAKAAIEKEKFIEMRASGLSFDKISAELNISKQTLIKWQKELEKEISNLEFLHHQSLIEQFKLTGK